MIRNMSTPAKVFRPETWGLLRLRLALRLAAWRDRRAGRVATRNGLTSVQAREFVGWLEGEIAHQWNERSTVRAMPGMEHLADYCKVEARTLERVRAVFTSIAERRS